MFCGGEVFEVQKQVKMPLKGNKRKSASSGNKMRKNKKQKSVNVLEEIIIQPMATTSTDGLGDRAMRLVPKIIDFQPGAISPNIPGLSEENPLAPKIIWTQTSPSSLGEFTETQINSMPVVVLNRVPEPVVTPETPLAAAPTKLLPPLSTTDESDKEVAEHQAPLAIAIVASALADELRTVTTNLPEEVVTPEAPLATVTTNLSQEVVTPETPLAAVATNLPEEVVTPENAEIGPGTSTSLEADLREFLNMTMPSTVRVIEEGMPVEGILNLTKDLLNEAVYHAKDKIQELNNEKIELNSRNDSLKLDEHRIRESILELENRYSNIRKERKSNKSRVKEIKLEIKKYSSEIALGEYNLCKLK